MQQLEVRRQVRGMRDAAVDVRLRRWADLRPQRPHADAVRLGQAATDALRQLLPGPGTAVFGR